MSNGPLRIEVKVTPRASRDEIAGMRDGVLAVRVTAAPVGDSANRAVVKLIARRIGVAPGRVRIARGARGRRKLIEIEGGAPAALRRLRE
ncbi:MAG TPA: DUF167 domain-containing protein [Solirubrobacterales bacterium]|nr:DUF167 domain-containing protein [Solirubrobacterales bacterium]